MKKKSKIKQNPVNDCKQDQVESFRVTWIHEIFVEYLTVLKMLTSTRKRVTRSAIRPGTTSGRMRNETQDTPTNRMHGR